MPRVALVLASVVALLLTAACSGEKAPIPPVSQTPTPVAEGPVESTASPPRSQVESTQSPLRPQVQTTESAPRTQVGTGDWALRKPAMHGQIEGYAAPQSVLPGDPFDLFVSTRAPTFRVEAYRLGGYRGHWGKHIWTSKELMGVDQPAAELITATNTVVTRWAASTQVETKGWAPGFYNLKLVTSDGFDYQVPMVVRSPSSKGRIVISAPLMTFQAYNTWGGYSLYRGPTNQRRSWAVSFDRPDEAPGGGRFMYDVPPVAALAETLDVPLAYAADTDIATDARYLDGAAAYISAGHDEYWTVPERAHVEAARDAGTNLAFLSANTMYWRVRLEPSVTGAHRMVVGYRADAQVADPLRETAPRLTSAHWRAWPAPNPENSLIGMLYECYPVDTAYTVASPGWWGFRGTGVKHGSSFAHLVGPEADRVYPIASTPRPLQILSHQEYNCGGVPTSTQSTYYTARSGAGVIAFGTQRWPCALRMHCPEVGRESNRFARQVMRNVFTEFAKGPVGHRFPARDNVAQFDLAPDNRVPAS